MTTTGKRVLFIDDDDALRQMLSEQFELHEEFTTVTGASEPWLLGMPAPTTHLTP